jgi:chorismate mutase
LSIDAIRKQIDRLDEQLLEIFNQRAALALEIGAIKEKQGMAIYDPNRERTIFEGIKRANKGPLGDEAIVRLFEGVIEESRNLEAIREEEN